MNKNMPKVSVILPSLNVAKYIEECMDSVICQTLGELEIICVDAGSTDGTREILDSYVGKDPRIILLQSNIKSYGQQVNMGLEYATGEYVAILETDDWIEPDMYQCLYENGAVEGLDYVAADFDLLYHLQSGTDYLVRQRLFHGERQDWYGRILDSDQIATLRASDYVLWKGIYNREFLNSHRIRLHSSPGAAFQDMGFLQQVKTYARRVKYLDRSFYRYRQDRECASSGAWEGLRYYENEFRWINEKLGLPHILGEIHRKYYYFTMSIAFITKYEQILEYLNGEWQDERLGIPYSWFREQIRDAIQAGILEKTMYKEEDWERLKLLLASPKSHARFLMEQDKRKGRKEFMNQIRHRPAVIFGCGIRGERMMYFCTVNQIDIHSFCDNNPAFHGGTRFGFPVISPDNLKETVNRINGVILLSMKHGGETVYRQLTELGINSDSIIDKIPDVLLR